MARLPTSVGGLAAPGGTRASTFVAEPTDYGLGVAADALGDFAERKKREADEADDKAAGELLNGVRQSFEPAFAERAAAYDGNEPGLSAAEQARVREAARPVLDTAPVGVRKAFQRRLDAYVGQVGDHALQVESAKRTAQVREQATAREAAATGGALVDFLGGYGAKARARQDSYDGSQAGYTDGMMADFDAEAARVLASRPEAERPALQARLASMRVTEFSQALAAEQKAAGAFLARNVKAQGEALVNGVLSNPAGYQAAAASLDTVVGALPAALRAPAQKELNAQLVEARLEGMIADDNAEAAWEELDSGRYDQILTAQAKSQLLAAVAREKAKGPSTMAEWGAAFDLEARAKAEIYARSTTGKSTGVSLDEIVRVFGPKEAAKFKEELEVADNTFAAIGDSRALSTDELRRRAAAAAPDPSSPDYAAVRDRWELTQKAAAAELATRDKDAAAWAMTSERPNDLGAQLQAQWQVATTATGDAIGPAGARYATNMLAAQERAGIAPAAQRILPIAQAKRLAESYVKAPPEQRDEALRVMAGVVERMPTSVTLPSGRRVSARELILRELDAAGLGSPDLSAIADLADDPPRMALYVAAVNNPDARKRLPEKGEEDRLVSAVGRELSPFFETANALPGSATMNAARRDRVMLTARHLVTSQGLSPKDAAKKAAADLSAGYAFIDGYRVPKAQGRVDDIRRGAGMVLMDILGESRQGRLLRGPANPRLTPEQRQKLAADVVAEKGRWVTREDDTGLVLMVPTTSGWTPQPDLHGRPISLTWSQLAARKSEGVKPGLKPGSWWAPPPAAAAPVKAATASGRNQAATAFIGAIEGRETGPLGAKATAAVSPKGALGVMQLMPDTARAAARRLGVAFDPARLTTDPAYNRRLAIEEVRHLSDRFDGNIALVAAAYNAGPGAVEAWLKRNGDPRRGRVSVDEWVASIPYKETREYVRWVLPEAMRRLTAT